MMTTRNSNAHFELAPQVAIERSTFDRSYDVKTSWNVGQLIPFMCEEILPGDTAKIKTAKAVRLQTLITPVMDNLYLDTYYFFVPNRLVWEHWVNFMGENDNGAWTTSAGNYTVPKIYPPANTGWNVGTLADYFGIPTGIYDNYGALNALPFRAYCKIVNDWFRSEVLDDPLNFSMGDSSVNGSNGTNAVTDCVKGGMPFVACKTHDYFTSCLPQPQRGESVSFLPDYLPVMTRNSFVGTYKSTGNTPLWISNTSKAGDTNAQILGTKAKSGTNNYNVAAAYEATMSEFEYDDEIIPVNLWVSNVGTAGLTINDLRQAFQIQRLLEKDARAGTRYIEVIKGHFGITSPDARLQRSEYLGGNRVPFNIEQVLQTSSTDSTTPQGNVSGWSLTNDVSFDVNKSFTEHGYIIGLMCARYDHSYQQGMECHWFRDKRTDYYFPVLAHLGEKPVYKREICWVGDPSYDKQVFGYQEAWSEYRYKPNYITGMMRSQYAQSLDIWHFGDYYYDEDQQLADPPSLSSSWLREDKDNIDRCLAVPSSTAHQIFGDIYIECKMTRPMPLYSIPGLVDHF